MPKISVITSTYNRSKDLLKAIESVQHQTFTDWEMIIVDDCSPDDTEKVVKEVNDPRIKYIKLEKNFGNDTHPKNVGILASEGPYVAFLDDDNTYRPDHLLALLTELENNVSISGVYGDRFIYKDGKPGGLGVTSEYDSSMLLVRNYIDTSDVLIRREVLFDLGGFDERFKKYIDWNLWVRISKANYKMKRIPTILTDYNINSDSKSLRVEDTKNNMPAWNAVDCEVRLDYLGKKEPIKVAIFSITYDRLDYTKECFDSLYKTAGYDFDHIIVDNGSKDGTVEYLQELENPNGFTSCVFNEENKGISIASNQALDLLKGRGYDIIMKVDNDAFFKNQGWLAKMVEIHSSFPRFALSCYVEGLRDNPGGAARIDYMVVRDELIGYTVHLGGICHFVDARAYDNFRWEEDSFLHGVQDMELSQYLNKEGWFMGYMESWFVEHRDGTVGQHEKYPDYFKRREIEKATRYEKDR
jgi:glycosyltransferase involved in cell wall biosynthesis